MQSSSEKRRTVFPEVYTITAAMDAKGHDNLGHSIPELLTTTTAATTPNCNGKHPTTHATQISVSSSSEMSSLPLHNRPVLGRRTACGIDTFIIIGIIVWLLTIELGIFPHVKNGFYCDDKSISYKNTGDSISAGLILSSIGFVYPILWVCEAIVFKPVSMKSSRFGGSAAMAWFWFREYLFATILHLFVVDACKVFFGELRPHFLDTCRPDALETCAPGKYVTNYVCTNKIDGWYYVLDASKSFPSGHASIGFLEAIFLIWYVQARMPSTRTKLLLPTVQAIFLLWALLCAVSRITDHRHHWWDVLAGSIFGTISAILTCIYLCNRFERKRNAVEMVHQNGNDERHTSVRRLLSERNKDEVTLNHVVVP